MALLSTVDHTLQGNVWGAVEGIALETVGIVEEIVAEIVLGTVDGFMEGLISDYWSQGSSVVRWNKIRRRNRLIDPILIQATSQYHSLEQGNGVRNRCRGLVGVKNSIYLGCVCLQCSIEID